MGLKSVARRFEVGKIIIWFSILDNSSVRFSSFYSSSCIDIASSSYILTLRAINDSNFCKLSGQTLLETFQVLVHESKIVSIKISSELIVLVTKQLKLRNFLDKQLLELFKRNSKIKSENVLTYARNYLFTIEYKTPT